MHISHHFRFDDQEEQIAFMKQHSFATIVTQQADKSMATHLPFFVDRIHGQLILSSHLAVANEQAAAIETAPSLVIFTGPHAYISPAQYDKIESVPTWNYVAVHAYGKAKVLREYQQVRDTLEKTIQQYEPAYLAQWNNLPDKFKQGMTRGIVAFELLVDSVHGQKKLSQNKSDAERARIIAQLHQQGNLAASELATWMDRQPLRSSCD